ncbi:MAG: crossover junction endodeoxyribonuclease RuvC [Thermodesulfobacteriota bacterium]
MKVMGVDPGLANTGVALVSGAPGRVASYGFSTIRTSEKHALSHRLFQIFSEVNKLLAESRPDLVVVEAAFSAPLYPRSGISLGMATGAILTACGGSAVACREVAVRDVKRTLTGNGAASKEQLERAVRGLLNHDGPIKPAHASDALALALLGLFRAEALLSGGPAA